MPNKAVFEKRRAEVYSWLQQQHLDAAVLEDTEGRRNRNIRYLTGLPSDGLLFLFADGRSLLAPWDVELAHEVATADLVVPYTDYKRHMITATESILATYLPDCTRIIVTEALPHLMFTELEAALSCELVCRKEGIDSYIRKLRSIKSAEEQELYRNSCEITNTIIHDLEYTFASSEFQTELDVVSFIEHKARELGGEGTGFQTLVANAFRSHTIHPYPVHTNETILRKGLSLVDFGVAIEGYTSDVTVPLVQGEADAQQKTLIDLIMEAWEVITSQLGPECSTFAVCSEVESFFGKHGFTMPHALGHGIGLDAHEYPFLRNREDSDARLKPGMIIAVEPALYQRDIGGVRLENDILITETGMEMLTRSRILYFPDQGLS